MQMSTEKDALLSCLKSPLSSFEKKWANLDYVTVCVTLSMASLMQGTTANQMDVFEWTQMVNIHAGVGRVICP